MLVCSLVCLLCLFFSRWGCIKRAAVLLQKSDIFTKQAASSSFEVDFVTPTPCDFPDFHTFNHRQGNKSVKSTVALECWNEKNCGLLVVHGVTACPYSVVVYSPHVLSVVIRCTKMPLLRLAVNIVFLSFWELFSSEAKEKRSFEGKKSSGSWLDLCLFKAVALRSTFPFATTAFYWKQTSIPFILIMKR